MSKEKLTIYWKSIQFDVCLPKDLVWPFVQEFGVKFSSEDGTPESVDRIFFQGGYHIKASVHVSQEVEFYDFLRFFAEEHHILLREKDLEPCHTTLAVISDLYDRISSR